jgi:hypothetical protein
MSKVRKASQLIYHISLYVKVKVKVLICDRTVKVRKGRSAYWIALDGRRKQEGMEFLEVDTDLRPLGEGERETGLAADNNETAPLNHVIIIIIIIPTTKPKKPSFYHTH